PQLRQLERDVPLDARLDDDVEEPDVFTRRSVRLVRGPNALAEVVEREVQPLHLDAAGRLDGLLDALAGDEAAGEAVARPHPVLGREPLERRAARECIEERFGTVVHLPW